LRKREADARRDQVDCGLALTQARHHRRVELTIRRPPPSFDAVDETGGEPLGKPADEPRRDEHDYDEEHDRDRSRDRQ
jgi:hypothetical protein